jgi:hypothetical protein
MEDPATAHRVLLAIATFGIAALVVVSVSFASIASPPRASAGGLPGDANCNGHVDPIDAAIVLQFSAGLIGLAPCPQNANVNGDSVVNPLDAALILQYAAGLIPSLGTSPTPTPTGTRPTLSLDKFGQGTVTSSPAGISCSNACTSDSASYQPSALVTLTASPATGWMIANWSGCDSIQGNSCRVTLDVDKAILATFAQTTTQIPSTTKVLDSATMGHLLSQVGSTYHFDSQASSVVALQPGDVIVASTGDGLLRKVSNVTASAQEIVVETTDASLEDAVQQGTLAFSGEGGSASGAELRSFEPAGGLSCVISTLSCSISVDTDLPQNVHVSGDVSFDLDPQLAVTFDGFDVGCVCFPIRELRAASTFHAHTDLTVSDGASFSVQAETTIPAGIATFVAAIGPVPVVVQVDLGLTVGVNGQAGAAIQGHIVGDSTITVGAHYARGQGWSSINNFSRTFSTSDLQLTTGAEVKGYVGPKVTTKLYGVAGPEFHAHGYMRVEADPLDTPWWKLFGGLEASASLDVGVLGHSVTVYAFPSWHQEWLLAQASAPQPTLENLVSAEKSRQADLGWTVACADHAPHTREITGSFDSASEWWIVIFCETAGTWRQDRLVFYQRQADVLTRQFEVTSSDIGHIDFLTPTAMFDVNGDGRLEVGVWNWSGCNDISCSVLHLYRAAHGSVEEVPVTLPLTGLGADNATPSGLSDIDGDGVQEIVAADTQWVLHGFCHACSPYSAYVLAWDGSEYSNASRDSRFQSFFDNGISQSEEHLASCVDDQCRLRWAIEITLDYGHSGRADAGWARLETVVSSITDSCWLDAVPQIENDLELSVPRDGSEPTSGQSGVIGFSLLCSPFAGFDY